MTAALWETLNGLGYIAALWLAFLVGMARPQVLSARIAAVFSDSVALDFAQFCCDGGLLVEI